MLQQTQVARVLLRYADFLAEFPTVAALAAADEQQVLSHWQGLGYYRRARHLHAAARMVVKDFDGRVPKRVDELLLLPGVGRYTAGAISSIVYGEAEPIVDGNVERVLARWFARRGAAGDAKGMKWAWKTAERLVKQVPDPGAFNEALMELGSLVCTPQSPKCGACPVAKMCQANRCGLQDVIPGTKKRTLRQVAHHHAVILTRNGKVLMERRGERGMWAGLWQTPTVESDRKLNQTEVKNAMPHSTSDLVKCGSFYHQTSHRSVHFHVYLGSTKLRRGSWKRPNELADHPMGNAQKRVLAFAIKQKLL